MAYDDDRDEERKPPPGPTPPGFFMGVRRLGEIPGAIPPARRVDVGQPPDVTKPAAAPPEQPITPVRPGPAPMTSEWLENREAMREANLARWREKPTTTMGKIMRPLRNIGYGIGEVLAPGVMAMTPGTPLYEELRLGNIQRELPAVRREEAMTEEEKRRTDLEQRRVDLEALKAGQPKPTGKKIYGPGGEEMNEYEYQTPQGPVMGYVRPGESPMGEGAPQPFIPGAKPPEEKPAQGLPATPIPQAKAAPAPPLGAAPPPQAGTAAGGGAPTLPARTGAMPKGWSTNQLTAEQKIDQRMADISQIPEKDRTPDDNKFYAANYPAREDKLPLSADMRMGYMKQIAAALKDYPDVNQEAYTIPPGATGKDAKEILGAAQKAANESRATHAPEKAQRRKDEREPVYVQDAKGQTALSNRAAAEDAKQPLEPVDKGRVAKDRVSITQIGDVQSNVSYYTKAARDYEDAERTGVIGPNAAVMDQAALHELLNRAGLFDLKLKGVLELDIPLLNGFLEALSREARSTTYAQMSRQGKDLFDAYQRTLASIPGYQKMLFETGRNNKEMLDLELATVPDPSFRPPDILRRLRMFQQNIDRATARLPNNLPGMETSWPANIRKSIEGAASQYEPGRERIEKPPEGAKVRKFDQKTRTWSQ